MTDEVRSHLLNEPVERMAGLFEPGIDASRTGVVLSDRGAARELGGDVGRCDLYRFAVREVAPFANHHSVASLNLEPFGGLARHGPLVDADAVYARGVTDLLCLREERGLPPLTVPAREPLGGKTTNDGSCAHEHASAMF